MSFIPESIAIEITVQFALCVTHIISVVFFMGACGNDKTVTGMNDVKNAVVSLRELGALLKTDCSGRTVRISLPSKTTNKHLAHLKGLPNLQHLFLEGEHITDDGLRHLASLKELRFLRLSDNKITDKGLECLAGLTNLRTIYIGRTNITDEGLRHLRELHDLRALSLNYTKVTDEGMNHIVHLNELRVLGIVETDVSATGAMKLRQSLPKLTILQQKGELVSPFRRAISNP